VPDLPDTRGRAPDSAVPTLETETRAIACTLGPGQLATQAERWTKLYADAGTERLTTDDGLRVSFRPDPTFEKELRALVAVEVECCRWASWRVDAHADALILEIGSTGEGVPVIQSWLLNDEPPTWGR
jgi:hypothetical protein